MGFFETLFSFHLKSKLHFLVFFELGNFFYSYFSHERNFGYTEVVAGSARRMCAAILYAKA